MNLVDGICVYILIELETEIVFNKTIERINKNQIVNYKFNYQFFTKQENKKQK